jgi:hypothetical protein
MDTFNEVMNRMMTYSYMYICIERYIYIWYWKHLSCVINRMHIYSIRCITDLDSRREAIHIYSILNGRKYSADWL